MQNDEPKQEKKLLTYNKKKRLTVYTLCHKNASIYFWLSHHHQTLTRGRTECEGRKNRNNVNK